MIYICTHVDFKEYPGHVDGYTILASRPLENEYAAHVEYVKKNEITPMQFGYSEGYHIHHIYKHHKDDWVGINHYRRYFDNMPANRTILPVPRGYLMHNQYAKAHNINDLMQCYDIIEEYFPEYKCDYYALHLYTNNMFVMRQADFRAYHDFVFGVLDKFNEQNGLHTDEDIYNFVERRYDQYCQKHSIKWQSRLQGFLMERIGSIFFSTYFQLVNSRIDITADRAWTFFM